ncbi:hypothetical protein GCM10008941_04820 [Rhizomicrobium palustre]
MGAAAAGRLDEAARLWDQLLRLFPNHPEALHFMAQRALQKGDAKTARGLLETAVRAAPRDPVLHLALAYACRVLGDDGAEMEALTGALIADPYCYPALLAKAAAFSRHGLKRQAARLYKDALAIVPPDERLSPQLREEVAVARAAVRANMESLDSFLANRLGALNERFSAAQTARVLEAKEAMIGRTRIYASEASLYRVPGLPAVPFFDRSFFPWMEALEAQTDIIRDELVALLDTRGDDFAPYLNYPAGAPLEQWKELNRSPRWTTLYLFKDGAPVEEHCALCPLTAAALDQVPLAVIPGAEPTAMFSALEPHTTIPAHTGITNARAVVHLPLILPGDCRFRVGNETRPWKMGEAWAFDDSIEHEAVNGSGERRVILIFNVWNPYLSEVERDYAAALISGYYAYLAEEGA